VLVTNPICLPRKTYFAGGVGVRLASA